MEALGPTHSAPGAFHPLLGAASIYQSTDVRKEMNLRSISDWNCRGPLGDRMQLLHLGCRQSPDSRGHADSCVFSLTPSPAQLTAVLPFRLQTFCAFPTAFLFKQFISTEQRRAYAFPRAVKSFWEL